MATKKAGKPEQGWDILWTTNGRAHLRVADLSRKWKPFKAADAQKTSEREHALAKTAQKEMSFACSLV